MWIDLVLLAWTGCALAWWLISILAVHCPPSPPRTRQENKATLPSLTVFKPLPRLSDTANLHKTAAAVHSFIVQLRPGCEMILGIHPDEMAKWKELVIQWRRDHPFASVHVVIPDDDHGTDRFANRKVSWQSVLARHAQGELWLWSDADISAPAHYLDTVRSEYQNSAAGLITNSYVVRSVQSASDLLNALFVNAEIYPGVRFIGQRERICFGLGAGLLFSRKDFMEKVEWADLGSHLADDFQLGQRLQPARLGSTVLETYSGSTSLLESVLHYLRWQKTIRWCQPLGFAGQIVVLPFLGWLVYACLFPHRPEAWVGLGGIVLLEAFWVSLLFRFTGCRPALRFYGLIPVWTAFRVLAFIACWLPWPVIWRSQAWWKPVRPVAGGKNERAAARVESSSGP